MSEKGTLLVVEDDPGIQSQLRWCFDGYSVVVAGDRDEALAQLRRHEPQVVTLDMGLPPDPGGTSEGLATLEQILSMSPRTKVIVVTGNDDRASAVKAIALGAHDFYMKTPLIMAVEAQDEDLVKLILDRGGDPTLKIASGNSSGQSAIEAAGNNTRKPEIKALLQRYAAGNRTH